jgi:hypothetical protein
MRHDGRRMFPASLRRRSLFLRALSILILVWAPVAHAQEDPFAPSDETQRWVPSIGFFIPVAFHKVEAKVDSSVRGPVDGEDLNAHMRMIGELELMTPRLFEGLGDPRVFIRAGAGRAWDTRHQTAKEGDPGKVVFPFIPGGLEPPIPGIKGQGSATRVTFAPYLYTAAFGLAFSVAIGEQTLRIKPSMEWRHSSTEIEGLITSVISDANDDVCPCSTGRLNTQDEKDYDALGVGLEFELDTVRTGPFMLSLFTSGQGYRMLNGRKLRTSASGLYDDGFTPIDVQSRVILDEWSFSWGLGVRMRWIPE